MEEEVAKKSSEAIKRIMKDGIATTNIDNLYKLVDIYKDIKEVESMNNYGEYNGRGPSRGAYGEGYGRGGYGEYGNYGEYGRRGYDMKYRGDDSLDRMAGEYGRYQESRNRYGAGSQESDKSFHYMVKALEDFIMVLKEEAETPEQKQQLMQTLQNSMR
jgi:hypothetical protein